MNHEMQAIAADELGPIDNYTLRRMPVPEPAAGEVPVLGAAGGVGSAAVQIGTVMGVAAISFVGGAIPALPANLPLLKGAALVGVDIRQFGLKEPAAAQANIGQLLAWAAEGRVEPAVEPVFDFADFRAALAQALAGRSLDKVVLRIA